LVVKDCLAEALAGSLGWPKSARLDLLLLIFLAVHCDRIAGVDVPDPQTAVVR
jgi:hypothetical protein